MDQQLSFMLALASELIYADWGAGRPLRQHGGWIEELPLEEGSTPSGSSTPLSEPSQEELAVSVSASASLKASAHAAPERKFVREMAHQAPIHDMLAPQRESRALESAQTLIEQQKERIESLTETVMRLQHTKGDSQVRLQKDLQVYIHENQRLRLQLDSMKAEIAALEQVRHREEKEVQEVVEALAAAEKGIADRDSLIKRLQREDKTAENEKLKEDQQRLLTRLSKLQKLTGTAGDESYEGRSPEDLAEQLVKVQREVELHRGTTRQLGHTTEELRISKMCLVQAEANLLEGQKLIEEQRAEIQRLYKIVEALNREKALTPPVVLTLPKHLRGVGIEQLEALSTKMGQILQALDRERKMAGADEREERTSMALLQQRMMEEQQALLKRQVSDVSCTSSLARTVLHACMGSLDEDADYREKVMAVNEGTLLLFYDPKDEEPTAILRPHKMVSLAIDASALLITLVYEPCPGRSETHLFKFRTDDELNRWHHALAYGGFIRAAPLVQHALPPSTVPPSSEAPSTPKEEMLVSVNIPDGIGFDGAPTLSERHNGRVQYNKARNMLIITSPEVIMCPRRSLASLLPFPSLKDNFSLQKETLGLWDETTGGSEQHLGVSASPIVPLLRLVGIAGMGTYYQPPVKKEPPPPPVAKPKEPPPPPPEPEAPEENELFVIRDGNLMLFEKQGDTQPILKLHHADCATHADPVNREFIITHKPGTPEEETYVFSFPTDDVYKGWYKKLEENGFLMRKGDHRGRTSNQVGVVSKGCLDLYKDYGTPDAKPVITLMANRCSATASRERREIRIIHTSPTGKRERITLDCASVAEFDRWNVALHFGNFLKGDDITGTGSQTYANLSKYVFPINLFEDASGRRSALLIENRMIMLFPAPEATEPVLCASADECEVQPVISQRKLRVYVNRNTRREQRIDFILALAKDFDRYVAACQRDSFPEAVVGKPMEKLAIPFVLCRKGLMAVYKSKFHAHAELTLEVPKYTLSEEGTSYVFVSNEGKDIARRVNVISADSRESYGFVAEEAAELRKDSFLGSARAALGLLQANREASRSAQLDQSIQRPDG
ncbi:hypothetical protein cyc_02755 [Cyclospora cayetanensis]|uniref:PH domain-containing protein n=1 Tax=Cyclospora cayetanensis TaxID=88456 RepID=A0A1D3CU27_9EIME|nr:hypothetical protein cyc_02755 [Cyclospora cayetanensis]